MQVKKLYFLTTNGFSKDKMPAHSVYAAIFSLSLAFAGKISQIAKKVAKK
jgi:hypothetical protein